MTYLVTYLAIGVVVLLLALLQDHMQKSFASDFKKAIMESLHPERKHWRYRLLHGMIVPTLSGLLVIVIWPFAIYVFINTLRNRIKDEADEFLVKPEFAVEKTHLVKQTSLQEIEANELIFDPLGAVPSVPFGHLNASWQQFIANMESGDTLWTFSALWKAEWGRPETRQGYAIVRDATIPHHYVTKYS